MARPAIAEDRITIENEKTIRLQLKTPRRDGTSLLLFTPSEFIEKLIALIPLLKRTFKIDVLTCSKCQSRTELIAVVLDFATIEIALTAVGISTRAPPIAPTRSEGIFA